MRVRSLDSRSSGAALFASQDLGFAVAGASAAGAASFLSPCAGGADAGVGRRRPAVVGFAAVGLARDSGLRDGLDAWALLPASVEARALIRSISPIFASYWIASLSAAVLCSDSISSRLRVRSSMMFRGGLFLFLHGAPSAGRRQRPEHCAHYS